MSPGNLRTSATRMKRTRLNRFAPKRGGISRAQQADLRELNRTAVMLRHGAFLFEEGSARRWFGECAICGKECWLQCCHVFSQGKYRRAAYIPENCFAACWRCHLGGPGAWHKEPTWAKDWIVHRLGQAGYDRLKLRVETAGPVDYTLSRLYLLEEIRKMEAA